MAHQTTTPKPVGMVDLPHTYFGCVLRWCSCGSSRTVRCDPSSNVGCRLRSRNWCHHALVANQSERLTVANAAKRKGSAWEGAIVTFLRSHGLRAQRIPAGATDDQADIFVADPDWPAIQAKNCAKHDLSGWLREVEQQARNADRTCGIVWFKKRGSTDPGEAYVLMTGDTLMILMEGIQDGE